MGIPVWVERQATRASSDDQNRHLMVIVSNTAFTPHQGELGALLDKIIQAMKLPNDECDFRVSAMPVLPDDADQFETVCLFGASGSATAASQECLCLPSLDDMHQDRNQKKQAWATIQNWLNTRPSSLAGGD